jgi:hypothetical protein
MTQKHSFPHYSVYALVRRKFKEAITRYFSSNKQANSVTSHQLQTKLHFPAEPQKNHVFGLHAVSRHPPEFPLNNRGMIHL